jgi:LCP family protein required for cell wall assembly
LRFLFGFFLVIFLVGGLYSGYLIYNTVREIVGHTDLPVLPRIQLPALNPPSVVAGEEILGLPEMPEMTPVVGTGELAYAPPPSMSTAENRINILLLGIDRRNGNGWAHRTDTIIVISVDPDNKTVGMMSIPRDLQISIPGRSDDRINSANVWGYNDKYPGGGPALLMRAIEVSFGIDIDHYVMVDFEAFVQIVDILGGIDVDVPKTLHDERYPDPKPGDPHAFKTIHYDAGWQHLDGQQALEYARSRMSTSDFDRAKRQQQILVAIRNKALSLKLLTRFSSLVKTLADNYQTDMTSQEMVALARLVPAIDTGNMKQLVIQKPMVYGYKREDGAAVQLPKWDLIRPAVDELFGTSGSQAAEAAPTPTPAPPAPTPTLAPIEVEGLQQLAEEGARIAIQNGTNEPNFAAKVAAYLMQQGFQVVEFGDADRVDYVNTVIVDYDGKTFTLQRLVDLFQVLPENVRSSPNPRSQVDIRLIVGQDSLLVIP